jgi:autotransporter-associated beta strand protein
MIQPSKSLSGPLRLILVFVATAFVLTSRAANWYVATNGSDSAAGTLAAPLQTISKGFSKAGAGDTIYVRGGTYRQTVSLVGKSGSAGNPITLTSYTNETAILSGLDVQSLTWTTNSGISNVWVTTYTGGAFEQMFVDGKPMLEARWPNVPTNADGSWNFFSSNCWATVDTNGNSYGTVSDAHLAATGWNITGWRAVLNVSHQFYTWTRIVTNHTAGSSIFNYPQDLGNSVSSSSQSFNDDRYYLVGNTNLLSSPGEWCYDAPSQRLYFYPFNGKDPNTSTVEIKTRNFAFTADKNSSYLTVSGITFWGTAFEFGTSVDNRSSNIILNNNSILYSSWTEWLNMTNNDPHAANDNNYPQIYADNSQILNNTYAYGALSALYIFGWTNLVENNVFHDFDLSSSLVYPPLQVGNAILYDIGKYGQATVRYNTLYNSGGILAQIVGINTDVYKNDFNNAFRACWGGNVDTAALYNTTQSGVTNNLNTRFHHNWVHEGYSGSQPEFSTYGGGLGIRGDDNTVGLTVDHNVTWDLGGAGIEMKNVTNPIPAQANACINNTVFNYNAIYTTTNGAIYVDNAAGGSENALSSVANNLADSIYGNWGAVPAGSFALYASNSVGLVTVTNLQNIGWYDFRPQPGAAQIVNHGVSFSPTTTNWIGSAPDIGAYELGDSIYFIPGQRSTNATFPIVPNGAIVPTNRDVLMWRPAYNAASHTVYFGASPGAMTNSGTFGGETNVFTLPALAAGQSYYWRVDAVMTNSSVVTGNVWSFSTVANPAIWDGGSLIDANWMTAANWNSNIAPSTNGTEILTFVGTTQTNNFNNFPTNTTFAGINFSNTTAGQSFILSGNPISLGGNILLAAAGGTINDSNLISMFLTTNCTITANTSHNLTASGIISDDGGTRSLTKDGAGMLTLSATNSFTGALIISNGTVSVNSIAAGGVNSAIGAGNLVQFSGGTLLYTGGATNVSRAFNLTANSSFQNNSASYVTYNGVFTGSANTITLTGTSVGSGGANDWQSDFGNGNNTATTVQKSGAGNWTISGAIKTGTAGISVVNGILTVNNNTNNFSGAVSATGGGTLNFTSITSVGAGPSSVGAPTTAANGLFTLGSSGGDGVLNYIGTGASTDRRIKIGNTATSTGNARINNNGSGALVWTNPTFMPTQTGYTVNHSLTLGGTNTNLNEIKGAIIDQTAGSGQTSLIKTDLGIWILSGTNTYTGATTVSNGTLLVNSPGSLAAGSAVVVRSGAILGGNGSIGGVVTFNSGSHAMFTNGTTLTLTNSLIIAASGTIADVILNLSSNVPAGTYTLATYNQVGSSGAFNALVSATNSGSFAPNTTNYITTAAGQVNLNVLNLYTLNYGAGVNGFISGATNQTVVSGGSGNAVTAVSAPGYHFVNWSDSSTANPRTDAGVGANLNVTANFAINTYTLTYNAGVNGTLSGSTSQTVPYLSSGTQVTAVPNTGYHFTGWSDGVLTSNRTDTAQIGGTNVTASFALSTPSPASLTNAIINGNQLVLDWPAGQGWALQIQINDLNSGLSTNWSNVILPASAPPYTNTINPETPTLFYRLKY